MKCLQLRITHTTSTIHPIHEFERQHASFRWSELVQWNPTIGETNALIFRVFGDPEAYRELLDHREKTQAYTIAPVDDDLFYCLVYEELTERDRRYVDAFADTPVVVTPPVRYNQNGTIDITIVGSRAALDEVLRELPPEIAIDVLSITDYQSHIPGTVGVLTSRQREAVTAAVENGYYESPRQGTVGDVAERLGVTRSTAAEHLRKAEAAIMREMIGWR